MVADGTATFEAEVLPAQAAVEAAVAAAQTVAAVASPSTPAAATAMAMTPSSWS